MSLSMVMPTYTFCNELEEIALEACRSYREQVDELIITEDGGNISPRLKAVSDIYLYHPNFGFSKNINFGWEFATGDYVAVVNSDTKLVKGQLKSLCVPNYVTSPLQQGQKALNDGSVELSGAFWVADNSIDIRLCEDLRTYFSDTLYANLVLELAQFALIEDVVFAHQEHATLKRLISPEEELKNYNRDKRIFWDIIGYSE